MTEQDLLILVVYILSLVFVYNNALDSLKGIISVEFDAPFLQQQISTQELSNLVAIRGDVSGRAISAVREIFLSIENKSPDRLLYVVWDQCVINDFNRRSRRVIRLSPGITSDLMQPQAYSTIAPGQILRERITAEDVLKRNKDTQALEIDKPLFGGGVLSGGDAKFSLILILQSGTPGVSLDAPHLLVCQFRILKTSWVKAVTWKPRFYRK